MVVRQKAKLVLPASVTAALLASTLPFGAAQAAPEFTSVPGSASTVSVASVLLPESVGQVAVPAAKRKINRDPKSVTVFVNKDYPLSPKKYAPKTVAVSGTNIRLQTDAAKAYTKMVKAAKKDGVNIRAVSGYRSYARQAELFNYYTRIYGKTYASRICAVPGTSEHQTGLAVDVGNANGACGLQSCFANTPVGKWVAKHAHTYGFILRYPSGQESVTGYAYEPWHFRYVGTSLAKDYKNSGAKSLEAYYGVSKSGSSKNTDTKNTSNGKGTAKTTANLNQRTGAGTGNRIIQTIPKGKTVKLTGSTKSGWYQVSYGSKTGWVSGTYLKDISTKSSTQKSTKNSTSTSKNTSTTKTTTANLNMRTGASASKKIVLTIPKGKKVSITGAKKNGWYPVKYNGKSGWSSAKYLR